MACSDTGPSGPPPSATRATEPTPNHSCAGIIEGERVVRHVGVHRAGRPADHRDRGLVDRQPARHGGRERHPQQPVLARSTRPRGCGTRPGRRRPTAASPGSPPGRPAAAGPPAAPRPGSARPGPPPGARPTPAPGPAGSAATGPRPSAGAGRTPPAGSARCPARPAARRRRAGPGRWPGCRRAAGSAVTANRSFSIPSLARAADQPSASPRRPGRPGRSGTPPPGRPPPGR